jgi:hypothetical protein
MLIYSTVETKEEACIGYNRLLFLQEYSRIRTIA